MGGIKKYIEMFGSFTEPFNYFEELDSKLCICSSFRIFARSGKIQDCVDDKKKSAYALMRDVFYVMPVLCPAISQGGGARA